SPMRFAGQPYTLFKNDAEVKKALFDEYGRLSVEKAEKGAHYQVKLTNCTVHDDQVSERRMESDQNQLDYREQQRLNRCYTADGEDGDKRKAQRERGSDNQ